MPPDEQHDLIRLMADYVVPGGYLFVSSYSEPADTALQETYLTISRQRLLQLGMSLDMVEMLMKSRGNGVYSLDRKLFENTLRLSGFNQPVPLMQGLLISLWLVHKKH